MKNQKDDLFAVIKSLTNPEKAYIKKFALRYSRNTNENYIKLFNEIVKQTDKEKYDEKLVKQKFINKKLIKNFPAAKAYVYKIILRSLNSFYAYTNKNDELKENIRSIEILYRKTLYPQCIKLLKRSKAKAVYSDNFIQLLEMIKWERYLMHEGAYEGKIFKNLERTCEEEKEILAKLRNRSDYRLLTYRVFEAVKNQQEASSFKEFLNNPLLQSEASALSLPAKVDFHHIRAVIFEAAGELLQAYREHSIVVEKIEENPKKIKIYEINYLLSLYNLTSICLRLKLYDEFSINLKKFRSIPEKISKGISENMSVLMFAGLSMLNLRIIIDKGEFDKGIEEAEEFQKGLLKFKNIINPLDELTCIYYISYIYFGAGDYQKAVFWLNKIINDKTIISDITKSAIMLNMIVHFELKDYELLEYLIKSEYRRLRKQKKLNEFDQELFSFLKKTPDIVSAKELIGLIKETKDKITKFTEDKDTYIFDFESWFESKISGKKFADIVKEKVSQLKL